MEEKTIEIRCNWPVMGIRDRKSYEVCGNGSPFYTREETEKYVRETYLGKGKFEVIMALRGVPEEQVGDEKKFKKRLIDIANGE